MNKQIYSLSLGSKFQNDVYDDDVFVLRGKVGTKNFFTPTPAIRSSCLGYFNHFLNINPSKIYYIFSCYFNRLYEYRFTFNWRPWASLGSSAIVPCCSMGKCLDPPGMPPGVPQSLFQFCFCFSWASRPGSEKWDISQKRDSSSSLQLSVSQELHISFLFRSTIIPCLLSFLTATVGTYLFEESDHWAGAKMLQKTGVGGETSAGLRWEIQTASSFFWGYLPLCLRTGTRQPPLELIPIVPPSPGCLWQILK